MRNPHKKCKHKIEKNIIKIRDINQYIELRRVSGLSKGWVNDTRCYLSKFLKEVKGEINQINTINYLNSIQSKYSITGYRKQTYQSLTKRDIYKTRLKYQIEAIKCFGIHFMTPFYVLKTVANILLCSFSLKK